MKIEEIWKPIKGYEGLYEVSSIGRVKSLKRTRTVKDRHKVYLSTTNERILKESKDHNGYKYVGIHKNGTSIRYKVHRLVAIAFIENKNNLCSVDHIDCDKSNNFFENLRWCSRGQNIKYAWENGIFKRTGTHNGRSKIDESIALEIKKLLLIPVTQVEICRKLNVSPQIVCHINNGRTWNHVKI